MLRPDPNLVSHLVDELELDTTLARLLVNRGVTTPDHAERFLRPRFEHLHDPFLIAGMRPAVTRIQQALATHQRILIFGDDDVDGITATSVILLFLRALGAQVDAFIPRRAIHGHGLNLKSLQAAVASFPCDLVLTADCGTSSLDEIAWLRSQGIDTIVVDHHAIPDSLPQCLIINPQLPENRFPFPELAAVGVAFNLILALYQDLKKLGVFNHFPAPNLHDYLDLVSLGTVADVVPLRDENRIFVKLGLEVLRRRHRCGVAALLDRIHLNGQMISERTICYRLAPRLNAAGRVGDANRCVELLTTQSYGIAQQLAKQLEEYNTQRQQAEASILVEATAIAQAQVNAGRSVLVVSQEGWHQGVLGIVASRLLERFHRPTVLIAIANGRARGSARSPVGVNILDYIRHCDAFLENYGGHSFAAGLTLKAEHVIDLHSKIEDVASEILGQDGLPAPTLYIDDTALLRDLRLGKARLYEQLAPFGAGNREPSFLVPRLRPLRSRVVGRNHLRVRMRGDRAVADMIGFSMGGRSLRHGRLVDAVVSPRIVDRKAQNVELRLLGFKNASQSS